MHGQLTLSCGPLAFSPHLAPKPNPWHLCHQPHPSWPACHAPRLVLHTRCPIANIPCFLFCHSAHCLHILPSSLGCYPVPQPSLGHNGRRDGEPGLIRPGLLPADLPAHPAIQESSAFPGSDNTVRAPQLPFYLASSIPTLLNSTQCKQPQKHLSTQPTLPSQLTQVLPFPFGQPSRFPTSSCSV